MKKLVLLLSLGLMAQWTSSSWAAPLSPNEVQAIHNDSEDEHLKSDIRSFLLRMGYNDFQDQIDQALKQRRRLTLYQREVLKSNKDHYKIFQYARELAVEIGARVLPRTSDPALRARLIEFTAKLLTSNPLPPGPKLPPNISAIANAEERYEASAEYFAQEINSNILRQRDQFVSDIMNLIYDGNRVVDTIQNRRANPQDPVLSAIKGDQSMFEDLVGKYLQAVYVEAEVGLSKLAARTFVASVIRQARLNHDAALENQIAGRALEYGEILGNYISDEITFVDKAGKTQSVKIQPGDFLMEYSRGQEAFAISVGVLPTGIKNRIFAFVKRLYGNFIFTFFIADEEKIREKASAGIELSTWERIKFAILQYRPAIKAFSHVGMADVFEDPETGIKNAVAVDAYPDGYLGFVRRIAIDNQFALRGPYSRFGLVHYDPKKFFAWAKHEQATRGYQEAIWQSDIYDLDSLDKDGIEKVSKAPVSQMTTISRSDYENMLSRYTPETADLWVKNEVVPRLRQTYERYISTSDAKGFAYGFKNGKNMAYCSQLVVQMYLTAVDIDPQPQQDRWSFAVYLASKAGLEMAEDLDFDQRIVSPNGFAWQSMLVDKVVQIEYPKISYGRFENGRFGEWRSELNPRLTSALSPWKSNLQTIPSDQLGLMVGTLNSIGEWAGTTYDFGKTAGMSKVPRDNSDDHKPVHASEFDPSVNSRLVHSLDDEQVRELGNEYRATLNNLGFDSNDVQISAARELAIYIMTNLSNRLSDLDELQHLSFITGQLLTLMPQSPGLQLPPEIASIRDPARRQEAVQNYINQLSKQQMEDLARKMTANIAGLLYGERTVAALASNSLRDPSLSSFVTAGVNKIYSLVAPIVSQLYMGERSQTAYLGRALYALQMNLYSSEDRKVLNKEIKKFNFNPESIVGTKWQFNYKDENLKIPIVDGVTVYESNTRNRLKRSAIGIARTDLDELQVGHVVVKKSGRTSTAWIQDSTGRLIGLEDVLHNTPEKVWVYDPTRRKYLEINNSLRESESTLLSQTQARVGAYAVINEQIKTALEKILPRNQRSTSSLLHQSISAAESERLMQTIGASLINRGSAANAVSNFRGIEQLRLDLQGTTPIRAALRCESLLPNN